MFQIWWLWFILAAVFLVGEILTAGFFLLWFSIGAAVGAILAILGLKSAYQWLGFIVVSGVLFGVSRPFAQKVSKEQPPGIGADRFVGKTGVVLEEIDPAKMTGMVRVERDEWRAQSEAGDVIPVNTKIEVVRVEGTRLIVRKTV